MNTPLDEASDIGWLELGQFQMKQPETSKRFFHKNWHWVFRSVAVIVIIIELITAHK